jgi:hypothetical protein
VCLGILEVSFGNWFRPNRMNRLNLVRDQTLHYDPTHLYAAPGPTTYVRDPWGLRGDFETPADIDILTLGGSATDQRFITEGQTWQDVMQRSLGEMGKNVTVANAGVDGQSAYGHIKNFDWWFPFVPGLHPGYVLVYVGSNDLYKDPGDEYDELVRHDTSWKSKIRENSALYHVVRTIRATRVARDVFEMGHEPEDFDHWEWTTEPRVVNVAYLMGKRLDAYQTRLRVLAEKIRAMGAVPVFVTQPRYVARRRADGAVEGAARTWRWDDIDINGLDLYFMLDMIRQATLRVGAAEGAICIDAAGEVAWERADFYDAVHNTPQGAEKLGRYLAAQLGPSI